MYLLDTSICIAILNAKSLAIESRMRHEGPENIALCSVVKAELLYGARNSKRVDENLNNLGRLFAPFVSFTFDDRCAEEYGSIRAQLTREGNPIGPNDLLIASIARAHDLVLATNNMREFSRVPGLRVENWIG